MHGHVFALLGGDPALNFLNTIHDWTEAEPRDYLSDFGAALRFGEAAGLLSRRETQALAERTSSDELRRLRELRARLERIFRALVDSRSPAPDDLDRLAHDAARAANTAVLREVKGQLTRGIDIEKAGVATLRWRIVDAAVALLTASRQRLDRVKACPDCGWFFQDETKNRSRRWCSMATCGSIAKSRRYYWRSKRRSGFAEAYDLTRKR